MPTCVLIEVFYFGLSEDTQQTADALFVGGIKEIKEEIKKELVEMQWWHYRDNKAVNEMGCVGCGSPHNIDAWPLNTEIVAYNNDVQKNKEVQSTRRDEQSGEASNQATSINPISPPTFLSHHKKKGYKKQFQKFMDVLKQLYINISFVDALEHMPSYVKVLKNIFVKKRRMTYFETIAPTQATSDVFKNGVLETMTHTGSLVIPCFIGNVDLGCAL
ncbi:hypothetical protein E5676_scaffold129G00290 [Cucumis melo var. makuwa]|uniref:Uncharacterized protein n=1 Tax=Cucumis melo var. makuwa TaxID=1194695 RepID=A0A5D3E113_CUCMM|nr:hypothetical protein E6C27_scaffold110G001440 [Cucumis melo var. makuwa]TYK29321.1 hypothetical protein E5676_scaffold129G00290 [Cucumis melo var. makuwa]